MRSRSGDASSLESSLSITREGRPEQRTGRVRPKRSAGCEFRDQLENAGHVRFGGAELFRVRTASGKHHRR